MQQYVLDKKFGFWIYFSFILLIFILYIKYICVLSLYVMFIYFWILISLEFPAIVCISFNLNDWSVLDIVLSISFFGTQGYWYHEQNTKYSTKFMFKAQLQKQSKNWKSKEKNDLQSNSSVFQTEKLISHPVYKSDRQI